MSSGAKRPPAEASVFAPGGPISCKPKRRKQSTPVRISGELGPDPSLPPPSPVSPTDHLLHAQLHSHHVEAQSEPYIGRYSDQLNNQNKENFADPYRDDKTNNHREHNQSQPFDNKNQLGGHTGFRYQNSTKDGGYFPKYREDLLDDDVKSENDATLTISRIDDKGEGDKLDGLTGVNETRLNDSEHAPSYEYRSPEERFQNVDCFDKYRREAEKLQDDPENVDRSQSPESVDKYGRAYPSEAYSCTRCGVAFVSVELLRLHCENEHNDKNGRGIECKVEPFELDDGSPRTSSGPTPVSDPRMEAWSAEFQAKMADLYKNALSFPHDIPKESVPANFNPLCPPFALFPTAVPPQRPLMEPIRIFNPEAYCELCSKEFCNKYFLKTHKANKHGIYENNVPSSGTEGLNLESSIVPAALASSAALKFKNNIMLAEYAKSYEAALLASQRHKAKIQKMMEEARDLDKINVDCQVAGPNTIINARHINLEDIRSGSDDNVIPENFIFKGDAIRHDQDEAFMTPTPRKLSPDSSKRARDSGFNSDTLRRLGVINPDAFCKICCKEYCNKYFLKTHKIKRHGLLPSPTERYSSKEPPSLLTEVVDKKEGQTSPLNLIMCEDNQDKSQASPETMLSSKQTKVMNIIPQGNTRPLSTHSIDSTSVDEKRDNSNEETAKSENAKQSPTAIFISEDLQKLQTMISQLNDLSVNKIVECYVCKKEFENNYILQFHMMSDHGMSVTGSGDAFNFPLSNSDDGSSENQHIIKTNCTVCDKEFPSMQSLKKHIEDFHAQKGTFNDSKIPNDCSGSEKEVAIQRERRASMSLTPTNSYCEICNKELCNKYFMKTHMQRMHGIEIENGTQIGGVICDICNKELCSKYFLRVHKHNTHGIVEPGAPLPQMRNLPEQDNFNVTQSVSPLKPPPEASILSNRFIAHFIEVCPFCSRRFRTSKWLKAHLLSDHGKAGVDKWKELEVHYKAQAKMQSGKSGKQTGSALAVPDNNSNPTASQGASLDVQDRLPFLTKLNEPKILNLFGMSNPEMKTYNCSYCPFSTSILSFLYVHEKSHAQGSEMDVLCPMCPESFSKPEALQVHIITAHSLPEWKESSPGSNRECQSRQEKTPPSEGNDENKNQNQASNGNGRAEMFECYECEFKSCNFGEMESHLKRQHCAVKDGPLESDNFGEEPAPASRRLPAIYAVPRGLDGDSEGGEHASITMQPFVIEENSPEVGGGKFVPSLVFLPVRRRATGTITISFNLTPA